MASLTATIRQIACRNTSWMRIVASRGVVAPVQQKLIHHLAVYKQQPSSSLLISNQVVFSYQYQLDSICFASR